MVRLFFCGSHFDIRQIKGVQLTPEGNERGPEVEGDLSKVLDQGILIFRARHRGKNTTTGTTLVNYVKSDSGDVTWKGFFHAFRETVAELRAAHVFQLVDRRNIFARLRTAYMGLVWRDLSIDLVAASLRQREFAKKITGEECYGIDSPIALQRALTRYQKFLYLLKLKYDLEKKKHPHIVPTLDIDLFWHTHQLYPQSYRKYCMENLDRLVNHDDTISKRDASDGLRTTSLAWLEVYNEPYTSDNLKKEYLSTGRKVAGIIFPPYGLHMLSKARRLNQARTGKFKFLSI